MTAMARQFHADDSTATAPPAPLSPNHTNTLESLTAFSRFEFEPGKSKEGTKVLMVEWEDYSDTRDSEGTWSVSWSGKTTVLPADERTTENIRRFYFLLPPGTAVPGLVKLSFQASSKAVGKAGAAAPSSTQSGNAGATISSKPQQQHLTINPLPAIFPPELGVTARTSGKKGVLHTIWAKKRLQVLDREIHHEQETNLEGIALEMALAEKEWIEKNFGVGVVKVVMPTLDTASARAAAGGGPVSAGFSPRSPTTGRRLSEKLKGLSLGTSDRELAGKEGVNTPLHEAHPLSPESSDVAFSSFNSFRNSTTPLASISSTIPPSTSTSSTMSGGAVPTSTIPTRSPLRKVTSQAPPDHILHAQQQQTQTGFSASKPSIPAVAPGKLSETQTTPDSSTQSHGTNGDVDVTFKNDAVAEDEEEDEEEALFAKALSPRTPDLGTGPLGS